MKGRTAVITGAGRGIGRAVACRFAREGAAVVIAYSGSEEAAWETARLCRESGAEGVLVTRCDVTVPAECRALVDAAKEAFGSVDILVNNAGITRDNLLMVMKESDLEEVVETNLYGTFHMMKAVSRTMMRQRYGRIINLSSVSGIAGNAGQTNYAASKAGVIGLTKSFAREVASRGITVNAIAPGMIDTDMTKGMPDAARAAAVSAVPAGRIGRPEDVANAAAFLAGEDASYITGHVLNVDGGMCM